MGTQTQKVLTSQQKGRLLRSPLPFVTATCFQVRLVPQGLGVLRRVFFNLR
jgi:hypothetical protein